MKYETPEMTALTPAIKAIQQTSEKAIQGYTDNFDPGSQLLEVVGAYADWE